MPKAHREHPSTGGRCSPRLTPEVSVTILRFALGESVRGRRETLNFSPHRKFGAARCLPFALFTPAGLFLGQAGLQDRWRGTFLAQDTPFPVTNHGKCFPDTLVCCYNYTDLSGVFCVQNGSNSMAVLDASASHKQRNGES